MKQLAWFIVTVLSFSSTELPAAHALITLCCNGPASISVMNASNGRTYRFLDTGGAAIGMALAPGGRNAFVLQQPNGSPVYTATLARIDTLTGQVVSTLPLGDIGRGRVFALDPRGKHAYIITASTQTGNHLVIVDTLTNQVVSDTIYSSGSDNNTIPEFIAVSPRGDLIYVSEPFTPTFTARLHVFVAATGAERTNLALPCPPRSVAFTRDGAVAYVPMGQCSGESSSIALIDTATDHATFAYSLPSNIVPGPMVLLPDGSAYLATYGGDDESDSAIQRIDLNNFQLIASIPLDFAPRALAASPDGTMAYAATGQAYPHDSRLAALDPVTNSVTREFETLTPSGGLLFSPSGDLLYMLNIGSSRIAVADVATGQVTGGFPAGAGAGRAAVSPDGLHVYVSNSGSANIFAINTRTGLMTLGQASQPQALAVSPDGNWLRVLSGLFVDLYNARSLKQVAETRVPGGDPACFTTTSDIALNPQGSLFYVTFNKDCSSPFQRSVSPRYIDEGVFAISVGASRIVQQIYLPGAVSIAISADGSRAAVSTQAMGPSTISVAGLDLRSGEIFARVPLPGNSWGIGNVAVAPDGSRAWTLDLQANLLYEVDLQAQRVIASLPIGVEPGSVALTPDGSQLWVTDEAADSVYVLDATNNAVVRTIPVGAPSAAVTFTAE